MSCNPVVKVCSTWHLSRTTGGCYPTCLPDFIWFALVSRVTVQRAIAWCHYLPYVHRDWILRYRVQLKRMSAIKMALSESMKCILKSWMRYQSLLVTLQMEMLASLKCLRTSKLKVLKSYPLDLLISFDFWRQTTRCWNHLLHVFIILSNSSTFHVCLR